MSRNTRAEVNAINDAEASRARSERVEHKTCKNCGNAITDPKGDNGCGMHTFMQENKTNCIATDG